jgi:hypothetical protein
VVPPEADLGAVPLEGPSSETALGAALREVDLGVVPPEADPWAIPSGPDLEEFPLGTATKWFLAEETEEPEAGGD